MSEASSSLPPKTRRFACPKNQGQRPVEPVGGARWTVCDLCRLLHAKGWLNADGGAVSVREGNVVYVAPVSPSAGETCPGDVVLLDLDPVGGGDAGAEAEGSGGRGFMMLPHRLAGAETVIHARSPNAVRASRLFERHFPIPALPGLPTPAPIPILDDPHDDALLHRAFADLLRERPGIASVIVRDRGLFVWGRDWVEVRTLTEYLDFLFGRALSDEAASRPGGPPSVS
jgi:ribulose-5-phosphate 4-epimerase/fuculose-1-phosphate aldolase